MSKPCDVVKRSKALLADISPGPWRYDVMGAATIETVYENGVRTEWAHDYTAICGLRGADGLSVPRQGEAAYGRAQPRPSADLVFLAAAPDLVRELIAEVQRLRSVAQRKAT
jgi:hypothetical protein